MIDWSDGDYEKTALTLEPATARVMEVALPRPGERVLDIGCGTGNAALAAARLGAQVTAVDPAARLLQVARERAEREGLTLAWAQGEAGAIPAEDARFDLAVSVFAAIFAPDAERVASELLRVVRPGGRVVMTSWVGEGAIAEAGRLLWGALAPLAPPSPTPPPAPPRWGERDFVEQLFGARGARVAISEESIAFTAASPAAWFAEQERHHPAWRFAHRALAARPGAWDELRDRSVERLAARNEDPTAFLTRSRYLLITVHRLERWEAHLPPCFFLLSVFAFVFVGAFVDDAFEVFAGAEATGNASMAVTAGAAETTGAAEDGSTWIKVDPCGWEGEGAARDVAREAGRSGEGAGRRRAKQAATARTTEATTPTRAKRARGAGGGGAPREIWAGSGVASG